ncbi:hypothetical protein CHS0354_030521 [Potamilus streckersoni]|uniref:F-BAR and double SH3 domains protein 2 n=1 Tax=Potamilus streckersoni TaxID=2493646 RepID=A0AAE0RPF8_9BIVA|nr:hypothetical protein CHS0354_030521 [Potamilus streckersoni]
MPQPPPRKVKVTAALKNIHSEQVSKIQAKHQQECDLLEDIRTFTRQRSIIEKEYAQALLKLTGQLLKRDFPAMPDLTSEDGQEHRTVLAVWRIILEETEKLAKKRLQAADIYMEKIAEPVKSLKANKVQCMKKVLPQLTTIQQEVFQTVMELSKAKKVYSIDENLAHDACLKAREAEEKLSRKSKSLFQSLASLQKNFAKINNRKESCEAKSTASRNEYLLSLAAANAHQGRYYTTDIMDLIEVLDGEIFDRMREYLSTYSTTAMELSAEEKSSYENIASQADMITRQFNLQCFLYCNHIFTDIVQYQFEPCHDDKCNKVMKSNPSDQTLDKEARKWATKIAKENKAIKEYHKALKTCQASEKTSDSSSENNGQDPETKAEELRQNIRKAETAKMKAEARIEVLRSSDVNVEEWLSSANPDNLCVEEEELPRTPSRTSLSSAGLADDNEPTYTNYEDEDDFIDETFDVSPKDSLGPNGRSGQHKRLVRCKSLYDFHASNPDELNMQVNEELEIIGDGDGDGWLRAKNSSGQIGYIPENYIERYRDDVSLAGSGCSLESADSLSGALYPVSASIEHAHSAPSLYTETPRSPPKMSNDLKQEVTSYSSGDMEVQEVTADGLVIPLEGIWVRALYDYQGNTDEELSFSEGSLIKLLRKDEDGVDDGFWEGEFNGHVGVFPSLVVEELDSGNTSEPYLSPGESIPPDYFPPPPVMVTEATPEAEMPPSSMANGTVFAHTSRRQQSYQHNSIHSKSSVNPSSYESAV